MNVETEAQLGIVSLTKVVLFNTVNNSMRGEHVIFTGCRYEG